MCAIGSIKQTILGRDIHTATAVHRSCIIPTASVGKEVEDESIRDYRYLYPFHCFPSFYNDSCVFW